MAVAIWGRARRGKANPGIAALAHQRPRQPDTIVEQLTVCLSLVEPLFFQDLGQMLLP